MRQVILAGLLAAAIPLVGCAYYQLEDRNAPIATFRFSFAGGSSQYSVVRENACEKGARLAKFGAFISAIKNVKLVAGKTVRIKARTLFQGRSGTDLNWCESVAEFTPQSDHSYHAWHYQPEAQQCVLKVEDEVDRAAPPDLVIQDNLPCPPILVSW
jgi:hypothetical protein